MSDVAVVFLVRGAEPDWLASVERFVASYEVMPAGIRHRFYVVIKGFTSAFERELAIRRLLRLAPTILEVPDNEFDIGAYRDSLSHFGEDLVCFINTHSEILAPSWLKKLVVAIEQPGVGMVGATGSFESQSSGDVRFPVFPNIHMRTNAFMLRRADALSMLTGLSVRNKLDGYMIESGPNSLTAQLARRGLDVAIVGRSGRSFAPPIWPSSGTFRQLDQANLLIGDNQTRAYGIARWSVKRQFSRITWGGYLQLGRRVPWNAGSRLEECIPHSFIRHEPASIAPGR